MGSLSAQKSSKEGGRERHQGSLATTARGTRPGVPPEPQNGTPRATPRAPNGCPRVPQERQNGPFAYLSEPHVQLKTVPKSTKTFQKQIKKTNTYSIHFSTDLSSILAAFCGEGPGKKGGPTFALMDVWAGGVTPWRKGISSNN